MALTTPPTTTPTTAAPPTAPAPSDTETQALFEEARQRRRRRYRRAGLLVPLAAALALGLTLSGGGRAPKKGPAPVRVRPARHRTAAPAPTPGIAPHQPGPLAVGPNGDLYVADDALDQILERQPDGRFIVIAGNGTVGFSGDGGRAVDAQLSRPQGMAFAADGTLYFADAGNSRVRAVAPDGTITTVAGDGQAAAGPGDTPVVGEPATATGIGTAQAVTISPTGALDIATGNAVVELDAEGTLSLVAGPQNFLNIDPRFPGLSECDPDGLAFDGSGDLFLSCSNWHDIVDQSPDGQLTYRGLLRPHDADAALSPGPDGSVLALWQSSLQRYPATGPAQVTNFDTVAGVGDFWPQAVAAAPDGTLYLDQDGISGIGPPAIIEEAPGGRPTELWTHPAGSSSS